MKTFGAIINHLCDIIRQCKLADAEFRDPLALLRELCEIKIGNSRPICDLVS